MARQNRSVIRDRLSRPLTVSIEAEMASRHTDDQESTFWLASFVDGCLFYLAAMIGFAFIGAMAASLGGYLWGERGAEFFCVFTVTPLMLLLPWLSRLRRIEPKRKR
jgi:hypothetical protein